MAIGIQQPPPSKGLMDNKAVKMVAAYFTGGLSAAGGAALSGTPAGNAMGTVGGFGGGSKSNGLDGPIGGERSAGIDDSAMSRRMSALQTQNPGAQVEQGLAALKDPNVPQYLRDAYAEPMLRAKHYGPQRSNV